MLKEESEMNGVGNSKEHRKSEGKAKSVTKTTKDIQNLLINEDNPLG
jgi:hypothetical protein